MSIQSKLNKIEKTLSAIHKKKEIPPVLLIIEQNPGDKPIPPKKSRNETGYVSGIIHVPIDISEENLKAEIQRWNEMEC